MGNNNKSRISCRNFCNHNGFKQFGRKNALLHPKHGLIAFTIPPKSTTAFRQFEDEYNGILIHTIGFIPREKLELIRGMIRPNGTQTFNAYYNIEDAA